MEKVESGTMPFMGTSILDKEGVKIVVDYIKGL